MEFVSFHTHTTYSYADGFGSVEEHVKRVASLGMRALALSEHGNVNSHAALERYCLEHGIKPIFGLEAYFGPVGDAKTRQKTHLTIFAMNEIGYGNLNRIVTQSYLDAYQWPTVSPESLKKHNEGLLVLSGCSDSLISCTLLGGKFLGPKRDDNLVVPDARSKADRRLQWFLDVFGPERFFLEVQRFPKLGRTCALNETFAQLGAEHGISLVATADVHYPFPTDNKMQAILHAARWKSSPDLQAETAWEYQANLSYPESDEEIINDLVSTGLTREQAELSVRQTSILAERCTVELPKARPLRVNLHGEENAESLLKKRINEGWKKRVSQRPDLAGRSKEYAARIRTELDVIGPKDFSDYFLATAELVSLAKQDNVTVGPGRGSAAGSLVCYILGITEIDPLHPTFQRMIFERFIDKNRSDMPDIDLDFDDELRWKIPAHARKIYGNENVANVANHITYKGKNTLNDIARAYGFAQKTFDAIAKRCPDRVETDTRLGNAILDVVTAYKHHPEISKLLDTYGDAIEEAIKLEGNQHSMGIHAGGFVIASDPIPEVCPIYTKYKGQGKKRELAQIIPYEKRDAEHLGMLKMDFLGLSTMGMIGKIRGWLRMPLDELYSLYYKDYSSGGKENERVLEEFRNDNLTGIFQYEGGTTREVVRNVRPDNFDELAACNALSRPGPLYGGQTRKYIAVKRGEEDWERVHPTGFDRHVEWTYGQIVYQEQIMWILRDLAGFSTERVLKVRKIIGKKLGEFQFAALWEEFRDGCGNNGVSEEAAERVWSAITTAAGYAFNTSHAYSYALVAWWSMYFKIHNTKEFFAGALAKNGDGKKEIPRRTYLLQDAIKNNVNISPFDPNVMGYTWTPAADSTRRIVPGFVQLPDCGATTASDIVAWRDTVRMPKTEWWHLINVKGIGESTIVKWVDFICQDDPLGIFKTHHQLQLFRKQVDNGEFDGTGLPDSVDFVYGEIPDQTAWVAWVGLVRNIAYKDLIEERRKKTGKSIEQIKADMEAEGQDPEQNKKATIYAYDEYDEMALRFSPYTYTQLAPRIEAITEDHHLVVVWGRTFEGRKGIQVRNLWVLDPE
ncbi:DnaE-like DNA polymerase III alpha [Mycobacterium phage Labelle]|nr:DnaE-like DNA polymerase III alpha [Mycobacterium phage Labelle]